LYNLASTLLCRKRSFPDVPSACKHATWHHAMQQHISVTAAKHVVASNANIDKDKHTIQLGVRTACCCYSLTTSAWQVGVQQPNHCRLYQFNTQWSTLHVWRITS
jgi:hypothetical protein